MDKNKSIPVTIHMHTSIQDQGRREESKLSAQGLIFFKGDSTYIRFDEPPSEDSPKQLTKQTLHFQKDRTTVIRNGTVNMNQQFIIGKETAGMLRSPYGQMAMRTTTKELSFVWDEEKREGRARLGYTLLLQEEYAGEYLIDVTIEEVMPS